MKAICDYTQDEYAAMQKKYAELRNKLKDHASQNLLEDLITIRGYAHYSFSGNVSNKLIELLGRMPTPNEIIMIVDGGFSHFGASCSINGRHFSGRVSTD